MLGIFLKKKNRAKAEISWSGLEIKGINQPISMFKLKRKPIFQILENPQFLANVFPENCLKIRALVNMIDDKMQKWASEIEKIREKERGIEQTWTLGRWDSDDWWIWWSINKRSSGIENLRCFSIYSLRICFSSTSICQFSSFLRVLKVILRFFWTKF